MERAERDFSVAISETTATIQGFQDALDIISYLGNLRTPLTLVIHTVFISERELQFIKRGSYARSSSKMS